MAHDEPSTSYELGQAYYRHEFNREGYIEKSIPILRKFNPNISETEALERSERAFKSMVKTWGERAENVAQAKRESAEAS